MLFRSTAIPEFVPIIEWWLHLQLNIPYRLKFEKGDPPSGQAVRQKYTDLWAGEDCLVYYHDHDSLISPEVCEYLKVCVPQIPKIYMFDQIWWANGPQRLIAKSENCVPCKCDISQLMVHALFLKDMVWTDRYENDGDFIAELYRRYPEQFVFVNGVNAWYNALRPNTSLYGGKIKLIA